MDEICGYALISHVDNRCELGFSNSRMWKGAENDAYPQILSTHRGEMDEIRGFALIRWTGIAGMRDGCDDVGRARLGRTPLLNAVEDG